MAFRFGKKAKSGWGVRLVPPPRRGRGWQIAGNLGLLLALWLAGVVFIHLGGPQRYAGLADGQRAPATVVAAVDFDCVNLAATELLRRQAAETIVPVFSIQMGPLQAGGRALESWRIAPSPSGTNWMRPRPKGPRRRLPRPPPRQRRWRPDWRSPPICWGFRFRAKRLRICSRPARKWTC